MQKPWTFTIEIEVTPTAGHMVKKWESDTEVDFRHRFFDDHIRPTLEMLVRASASGDVRTGKATPGFHYHVKDGLS